MNPCIKTGCDVAFFDNPNEQMRADAFYFNGSLVFRVRPAVYKPGGNIDFFITDRLVLELPDTIIASLHSVVLVTKSIQESIKKHKPGLIGKLIMHEKPLGAKKC